MLLQLGSNKDLELCYLSLPGPVTQTMRFWIWILVPLGLVLSLSEPDRGERRLVSDEESAPFVAAVDSHLVSAWEQASFEPAPEVDGLTLMRRLWLDLLGTTPSLLEIRAFQEVPTGQQQGWLVERVLADERFDSILAERLARIAVGGQDTKMGDLIYRRRRLVSWLTGQVRRNRPWDSLVRELIQSEGLSTDTPAVNFTISQDANPVKLAARTTRAFLGLRIDCAQCHDHPFARWKQSDFEGLAAYYARVRQNVGGVREVKEGELEFQLPSREASMGMAPAMGEMPADAAHADPAQVGSASETSLEIKAPFGQPVLLLPRKDGKKRKRDPQLRTRTVAPQVPFSPELAPNVTSRREVLATWLTSPQNPFFAKALVNRFWSWLLGAGLVEPVDELDTTEPSDPRLLQLLAERFVASGFDLKALVRAIVSTKAYRLDSAPGEVAEDYDYGDAAEAYALRNLKPLRGDQLGASILQAGSLQPYDQRRAPLLRFVNFTQRNEFAQRHGDDLSQEEAQDETLLQRLHLLNGKFLREVTKDDDIFAPVTRLALLAPSDEAAIEAAFLITLTRRPTPEEARPYVSRLAGLKGDARTKLMADLLWTLLNSTEFAWCR